MSIKNRLQDLQQREAPIRVGLVGAGQMGSGLVAQIAHIPGMEVVAVADVDEERARGVFREFGREAVEGVDGRPDRPSVTADSVGLARSETVDVIVEATGLPDVGARVAYEAIHCGKHVVMLNVETDVTVGATLARMARSAGVVYTCTAGDEPGAIMELYDFAHALGFEVAVCGKGKNNPLDVSATPESVAQEAKSKHMNPHMLASFVDGTKTMVEMAAVANATGFVPDVPGMHGPAETDPDRLAEVFNLEGEGGILSRHGVVEYVRGVAPGVFIVVRSPEGPVRDTMSYVGKGSGPNHVLYRPYHLTSLETPVSVARAALYGEATLSSLPENSAEVVAVAKRDLAAGEELGGIGSADYYSRIYPVSEAAEMLPIGIAAGARLESPIKRGETVPRAEVELSQDSFVVRLRLLQEETLRGLGG